VPLSGKCNVFQPPNVICTLALSRGSAAFRQILQQTPSRAAKAMPNYTAIVTLLAVLFYFYTGVEVAKARAKFGVKVPAISGQPDFERVFRAQMNTLEWIPIFLPSLWLFAVTVNDAAAAAIGVLWIFGRVLYFRGYSRAAEKRSRGFLIQTFAAGILLLGAFAGLVTKIVSGA
jgi:glutathione S-transferase